LKRKAQRAEALGYDWFSVMDHLIQIPGVGAPEEPFMEGWTALAALAAVTGKIRLGTLVTSVAYRNPALLAKMAAGIDIISRGRLTFGFGAGWYYQEYNQYGYVFPERPAVRIRQMEEAIRLIKTMWTETRATFHGKYFHVEEALLEPKPVQKPHPPIMIGGSGEQLTLRALARVGDACNIFGDPDTVRHKYDVLRRHCETEGRPFDAIERTNLTSMLIARDEAALKAQREKLGIPDAYRGYALTASQAIDLVGRYREAGVQTFICSFYRNDADSMELLASEVMPHFK
jgi:F420-dependent oxidoreductase-like protein